MDTSNNQAINAKGKERDDNLAPDTSRAGEQQSADSGSQGGSSLASRLQASAAGLSRAVVAGRPDATSMSSSSEKPHASTLSSREPTYTERGEAAGSRSSHVTAAGLGPRFSDPHAGGSQASAGYDSFLAHHSAAPEPTPDLNAYASAPLVSGGAPTAVAIQEARDGGEVLDLLLAPDPPEMMMDDPTVDPDLSPEDIDMLKKALFGEGQPGRSAPDWDNLLNFRPDFLVTGDDQGLQQHMGVQDAAEGSALWLEQWRDVLTNYHDEVWGDLGPLAQDARRELEEAKKEPAVGGEPGDMKALRRLRQILGQVRGF